MKLPFAMLALVLLAWTAARCPAQQRPRPLIVELKQQSLLGFPADQKEISTPVRRGGNLLFVPVEINGQKAGYFLVDTGAAVSLIDTQVATRLKLPVRGVGEAQGVGGKQEAKAVTVDQLALGGGPAKLSLAKHVALAADLDSWRVAFGEEFGGLLGATFWGQAPFTVDYRAQRLVFYNRANFKPPAGAAAERLYFYGGHPAARVTVNDKFSGLAVLDTGHEFSLDLEPTFVAEHTELFNKANSVFGNVQGVGGRAERWTTRIDSLTLFGRRMENVPVTFGRSDEPAAKANANVITPFAAEKGVGYLGGRELRNFRLTFDYFYERLYVEYVPEDVLTTPGGGRADPNARDAVGLSPLYVAVRNRDLAAVKALLAAGANPNTPWRDGSTPVVLAVMYDLGDVTRALLASGARTNFVFPQGFSLVHVAVERGQGAALAALLEGGASGNGKANGGITPLMVAAKRGNRATVEQLLAAKVDVNAADDAAQNALHYAVYGGNPAVVEALLAAGGNPRFQNRHGLDAIALARQAKKEALADLLQRGGARETKPQQ